MKFEVRYPTGARHDVTLEGTLAVLGRDPSCDLVLNDVKCSRRHAVIEAGPQGMAIRDSGSANGVYVNGKRVERSVLAAGDAIRLGEIVIKVLPEDVGGTMVMEAQELEEVAPRTPTPPPPAPPGPKSLGTPLPAPAPRAREAKSPAPRTEAKHRSRPVRRAGAIERPLTATLLAVLWGLSTLLYLGGAVYLGLSREVVPWARWGGVVLLVFLAFLGAALCVGLLGSRPWARGLQIGVAVLGLANCPFSLAAVAVLVYLFRSDVRLRFSGRDWSELSDEETALLEAESAEGAFAATLIGTVLLGALASGGLLYWTHARPSADPVSSSREAAVLADLRELAAAQRNFREGTAGDCGNGFADLEGLLEPMRVIPNYRSDGPAFLNGSFKSPERHSYRFVLETEDRLPSREGCPTRAYRRYRYLATPVADGRHFLLGADGVVHVASGRPARPDDPGLE